MNWLTILSRGRWTIKQESETLYTSNFSYSESIDSDGFGAANRVTASHLHQLASELAKKLAPLILVLSESHCTLIAL